MAIKKTKIIQIDEEKLKQYIDIINEYFITVRDKFLHQLFGGFYVTCPNSHSQQKPFNDYNVADHLMHKQTYGIFVKKVTKFMVFDIDGTTLTNAEHMKHILIDCLVNLGFERDYIFTVFSGKKGYHVYIFFETPHRVDVVNVMQTAIITKIENTFKFSNSLGNIEIRPTATRGVKLPLGLHQETNEICWFCDENNQFIKSFDVLFDLKKAPDSMTQGVLNKIKLNNNTDYCLSKAKQTNSTSKNSSVSPEKLKEFKEAYEIGIVAPHTRHNTLLFAALHLKISGKNEAECLEELSSWMDQQNPEVITTPKSLWQADVDNVVKYIYAKSNASVLHSQLKDIFITKSIIKYIYQNTKTKNQRIVLLLMIIDFIKYEDRLEDGGFRASATHIAHDARISLSMAKVVPRQLAARKLIIRDTNKPSNNPLVKTSSLFGHLVTWYTLSDDLAKLYFDALGESEEHFKIEPNDELYPQLNFYLHQEFSDHEIREWLKRDAFKSSELLYKDYCIKHIAKFQAESLDNLTA